MACSGKRLPCHGKAGGDRTTRDGDSGRNGVFHYEHRGYPVGGFVSVEDTEVGGSGSAEILIRAAEAGTIGNVAEKYDYPAGQAPSTAWKV